MADGFRIQLDTEELEEFAKDLGIETKRFVDKRTSDKMGAVVRNGIRSDTARGISPITGNAFPPYKNPERYPGNRKPSSPVNLRLTREFMNALSYVSLQSQSGWSPLIFYRGTENQLKEEGHRDGANGQPVRPTIPEGNETFRDSIQEQIEEILEERIQRVIESIVNPR